MNKTIIIDAIIGQLKIKAGHHDTAAKSAHAEATHEESMAEDKYDTRVSKRAVWLGAGTHDG